MEFVAVLLMIGAGGAIALSVMLVVAAVRNAEAPRAANEGAGAEHHQIAASLLYALLIAGGASSTDALRRIRREVGLSAQITSPIDVLNWAERFASLRDRQRCEGLLETAVRLVASTRIPLPLLQYVALLDLSFGLGFRTDALARLRERYPFDYVDHAKASRPRTAEARPLFERPASNEKELLRLLGLEERPARSGLAAAYRRMAAQRHPDRFHGEPADVRERAAAEFIEITRAYESLLAVCRD